MKALLNLSSHRLSLAFCETVFEAGCERLPGALETIRENYARCEAFRVRSDYNTGTTTLATGVCL